MFSSHPERIHKPKVKVKSIVDQLTRCDLYHFLFVQNWRVENPVHDNDNSYQIKITVLQ